MEEITGGTGEYWEEKRSTEEPKRNQITRGDFAVKENQIYSGDFIGGARVYEITWGSRAGREGSRVVRMVCSRTLGSFPLVLDNKGRSSQGTGGW